MKQTRMKNVLSLLLCVVLIAALALTASGCSDNKETTSSQVSSGAATGEKQVLGTGATVFDFTVVDGEGKETAFQIHTDKETVGDALLELGLIAGEEGAYGLYVKTVNGITVDYDKDGKYWAFYMNGEYAVSGVDTTDIVEGNTYTFKVE